MNNPTERQSANVAVSEQNTSLMAQVSCITITTLVVISLANLLLLLMVVLESRRKCNEPFFDDAEKYQENPGKRLLSFVTRKELVITEQKHLGALCVIRNNRVLLICGTTIISPYWVLTAAHCCELVKTYSMEKIKVSSNSPTWREGIAHDVEEIMRHSNYSQKTSSYNLCLIKVKTPFQDRSEVPAVVAGHGYRYAANTTAVTIGWSSKTGAYDDDEIYSSKVVLVPFMLCKNLHKTNLDETMFCAKYFQNIDCSFDSGGPLFQHGLLIGVVSFEASCASRMIPRVYTRLSYFEKWVGHVEQVTKQRIGVNFRDYNNIY